MGVNMPAHTVVFTSVRKFDGQDFRTVSLMFVGIDYFNHFAKMFEKMKVFKKIIVGVSLLDFRTVNLISDFFTVKK